MTLVLLMVYLFFFISILFIHIKTESEKGVAFAWGLFNFIIFAFAGDWAVGILFGLSNFFVAWLIFFLANYFEESISLRLLTLITGLFAMIYIPKVITGTLMMLFTKYIGS